jgi:hypothetical protein
LKSHLVQESFEKLRLMLNRKYYNQFLMEREMQNLSLEDHTVYEDAKEEEMSKKYTVPSLKLDKIAVVKNVNSTARKQPIKIMKQSS